MREQDHLADIGAVGEEHHQTIDAHAKPAVGRHAVAHGAQLIFVHRIALFIFGFIVATHLEEAGFLIQPTFLYNYPRDISPLAKSIPGDAMTVERFEGYVAGFELCNAFTELNDPLDQEQRFLEMGRDYTADDEERHPMDEDYLRAMRYGMPPNGGFGLGIDRLVMLFLNVSYRKH